MLSTLLTVLSILTADPANVETVWEAYDLYAECRGTDSGPGCDPTALYQAIASDIATVYVDQCDGPTCSVMGDSGTVLVPRASLPACAAEGLNVNTANGTCTLPRETPSERNDNGADFSL